MKICIINGPNLNLLGRRETSIYGSKSFELYLPELEEAFPELELEYFQSNHEGVIIDPGDNARAILKLVQQDGLTITKIINTHAHLDHVMAVDAVRAATGARFYLHAADLPILHDVPERASLWLDTEIEAIDDPED